MCCMASPSCSVMVFYARAAALPMEGGEVYSGNAGEVNAEVSEREASPDSALSGSRAVNLVWRRRVVLKCWLGRKTALPLQRRRSGKACMRVVGEGSSRITGGGSEARKASSIGAAMPRPPRSWGKVVVKARRGGKVARSGVAARCSEGQSRRRGAVMSRKFIHRPV